MRWRVEKCACQCMTPWWALGPDSQEWEFSTQAEAMRVADQEARMGARNPFPSPTDAEWVELRAAAAALFPASTTETAPALRLGLSADDWAQEIGQAVQGAITAREMQAKINDRGTR